MKLEAPQIKHLIGRAAATNGLHELATAAADELERLRLAVLDDGERQIHQLREEAGVALYGLTTTYRPQVEANPPNEELPDSVLNGIFDRLHSLKMLDDEAAKIHNAEALAFRYELRAQTAWLYFNKLLGLPAITNPEE